MTLIKCSCLTGILAVIAFKFLPQIQERIDQRVTDAKKDFSARMIVKLETQTGELCK